jgi:hypothetical protein
MLLYPEDSNTVWCVTPQNYTIFYDRMHITMKDVSWRKKQDSPEKHKDLPFCQSVKISID